MIRAEVIRPYPMIFDTGDWSRLQRLATSLATGGSARPGGNTSLMVTARRWHAISDQSQLNRALCSHKKIRGERRQAGGTRLVRRRDG